MALWQRVMAVFSRPPLGVQDLVVGAGPEAGDNSNVKVHYTGTLIDGTVFDSSRDRGQPFEFLIGAGEVIEGWERGVNGMRVGGRRRLTVPPHLGYGRRGVAGAIPGGATLIFEIELLEVVPADGGEQRPDESQR